MLARAILTLSVLEGLLLCPLALDAAPYADGQVLVRMRAGTDRDRLSLRLASAGTRALHTPGWVRVRLPPGLTVEEAVRRYASDPDVAAVQPNYLYRVAASPSDTYFATQYGLSKISAAAAWELEKGNTNPVTVAILDTGVKPDHADLSARLDKTNWRVFCPSGCTGSCTTCSSGGAACTAPITDVLDHGTGVAGIIGAVTDNAQGMAGVTWGASLLPIKIFDSDGCADSTSLMDAVNYASGFKTSSGRPMVINMSVGEVPDPLTATPSCDIPTDAVTVAVNAALSNNVVVVAAAGNITAPDYYQEVQCPGRIPGVIAVGATDAVDAIAAFSARGAALDVVAPGVSILSTATDGTYASADGTSFAAPHVAGLAALILSLQPSVSQTQVSAWILAGTDDLGQPATLQGSGRLNAYRSLRLASRGTLSDFAGEAKVIAFPNPFRSGQGTLAISVPGTLSGSGMSIKVYSASGQLVRTLRAPSWDGKNEAGSFVATGLYTLLVETDKGKGKGRVAVFR